MAYKNNYHKRKYQSQSHFKQPRMDYLKSEDEVIILSLKHIYLAYLKSTQKKEILLKILKNKLAIQTTLVDIYNIYINRKQTNNYLTEQTLLELMQKVEDLDEQVANLKDAYFSNCANHERAFLFKNTLENYDEKSLHEVIDLFGRFLKTKVANYKIQLDLEISALKRILKN